jgi:putative transcriptional regulator
MPRSRERWIDQVRETLERAGFFVSDTHGIRPSSFDLAARRDATLLLVKVLKNIDALDADEAQRLLELGRLFPAIALVIGQASGSAELDPGVVYTRYGVPIIRQETLQEYLDKALPPFLYASPGGTFARVDGGRLRLLRVERGLSLGALAGIAGVSRRAVQLYEEGAGAEVEVIERIEAFLGAPIVRPIDLFKARPRPEPEAGPDATASATGARKRSGSAKPAPTGDALRDGMIAQLDDLGLEVVVTVRAPFDALARTPDILLASTGSMRAALHRAEILHSLARVAEGHAMFIVREAIHRATIAGVPILSVNELKRHRDRDDFLDAITEREGP